MNAFIDSVSFEGNSSKEVPELKCLKFQYMADSGIRFYPILKGPISIGDNPFVLYLELYSSHPTNLFRRADHSDPLVDDDVIITKLLPHSDNNSAHRLHVYELIVNRDPSPNDPGWIFFLKNESEESDPKVKHRYVFVKSNKTVEKHFA